MSARNSGNPNPEKLEEARQNLVEVVRSLTPEARAVRQHLSKPAPSSFACGCMGQAALPGEEGKPWNEQKLEPVCRCAMAWVEQVDGRYYSINEERSPDGIKVVAHDLGPVGGPYLK